LYLSGSLAVCILITSVIVLRNTSASISSVKQMIATAMIEVLAESDVKELAIDNSIKAAENATEASKKNYTGLSNEQLAAELERRVGE